MAATRGAEGDFGTFFSKSVIDSVIDADAEKVFQNPDFRAMAQKYKPFLPSK
jgi:hypothetical protein